MSQTPARSMGVPRGRVRLTAVLTHPIQYYTPWFRYINDHAPDIDLSVLYAVQPTPAQQGAGFGRAFEWDIPLTSGYRSHVVRAPRASDSLSSDSVFGLDVPEIGVAIEQTSPDVVLIPGWYSITLLRALRTCRRLRIPVLYRGDTHLGSAPSGWRAPVWRLKTRRMLGAFSGYLSPGVRVREHLTSFGVDPSAIFDTPHCVDNAYFEERARLLREPDRRAAARARYGIDPSAFVVLFVGKLRPNKRPLDVIRALAACEAGATLLVAGGGELEEECRREAARLGVSVAWAGFLNQSEVAIAYGCADCLVLPSEGETWGLVVNEALATGLPCIVSDGVGCAPDLIDGTTGEVYPRGDTARLAEAIATVRRRLVTTAGVADRCRARVARYSFAEATAGLVRACRSVATAPISSAPRVIACFGHLVEQGGLAKMAFEVSSVLLQRGASVHCILNRWGNAQIVSLVERVGATWSTGYYWYPLRRRPRSPIAALQMVWDITATSFGLVREASRRHATHVFIPDYGAALRNAPGLLWLRARGVRVILRLGNAPEPSPFYQRLWRVAVDPLVSQFICISRYVERELIATGVTASKVSMVYNGPSRRRAGSGAIERDPCRVMYVGQLIPEKGVDLLLDAAALLVERFPRISIDIVGIDGGWVSERYVGYRERLKARAAQPDLRGRVRFLGWRDDVPELLASAAVHCHPARPEQREGFGNVVLEAKLAGTPSVVSGVGALPELIRHRDDGWVCETLEPSSFAEGVTYFLASTDTRLAAGVRARASAERFGRDAFADRWWHVFTDGGAGRSPEPCADEQSAPVETR